MITKSTSQVFNKRTSGHSLAVFRVANFLVFHYNKTSLSLLLSRSLFSSCFSLSCSSFNAENHIACAFKSVAFVAPLILLPKYCDTPVDRELLSKRHSLGQCQVSTVGGPNTGHNCRSHPPALKKYGSVLCHNSHDLATLRRVLRTGASLHSGQLQWLMYHSVWQRDLNTEMAGIWTLLLVQSLTSNL